MVQIGATPEEQLKTGVISVEKPGKFSVKNLIYSLERKRETRRQSWFSRRQWGIFTKSGKGKHSYIPVDTGK